MAKKMSKDEMRGGLSALFGEAPQEPQPQEPDIMNTLSDEKLREAVQSYRNHHRGRPKKITDPNKFVENYERITTIAHKEKMAKVREIAKREKLQIKDVFEAMMDEAIAIYEAKYGVIQINQSGHGDKTSIFKK